MTNCVLAGAAPALAVGGVVMLWLGCQLLPIAIRFRRIDWGWAALTGIVSGVYCFVTAFWMAAGVR